MNRTCVSCKREVEEWNEKCGGCGFTLELVPDERRKARFLRGPSMGALLFTQGWTFGARLYFWFLISLIPAFGLVALGVCVVFGRRLSWKHGGWSDWEEFQARMRLMDIVGMVWVAMLLGAYLWARFV
ncbi:hypothetical protein HY630_03745 [Candidatus Uhrbacteria bacterium]|nr:hypothetical protein [Candidatus Uhrbacteria bacterium]